MFSPRSLLSSLAAALLTTNFVVAKPTRIVARTSSQTAANNFTLAALNNTLPNANSTGAPLVLASAGAIDGESFHVSATYASYGFNDFPSLGLVDGNLRAFDAEGNWNTNASTGSATTINWGTSTFFTSPANTNFSVVDLGAASDFPGLAYSGFTNLWYLCPSDSPNVAQNAVYFNTTTIPSQSGVEGAIPIQCYSVTLNMVPV
ncbi:hypothetical protein D9757_009378 [Collybiopsis confluens]|uniref:Uncharacterized protein n=1 Tax=Collybiopsis confluens TaxID=2823264 RepID=A0A8H5H6Q2_9AGAR|nr:hypothetical protein D9757_009378 [Collybiopsis confluens]